MATIQSDCVLYHSGLMHWSNEHSGEPAVLKIICHFPTSLFSCSTNGICRQKMDGILTKLLDRRGFGQLGRGHDSTLQCSHKFGPQSLGTGTSEDRTTSQSLLAVRKAWNSSLTTGHTGNTTLPVPMFSLCVLWSVDIANFAPPSSEVDASRN